MEYYIGVKKKVLAWIVVCIHRCRRVSRKDISDSSGSLGRGLSMRVSRENLSDLLFFFFELFFHNYKYTHMYIKNPIHTPPNSDPSSLLADRLLLNKSPSFRVFLKIEFS